ncbi:MAG: TonB-dependent receptor [Gemmatimonadetes bacterium]|nr:TonB-dependent receptor [Gemmatimonadota bacterium]
MQLRNRLSIASLATAMVVAASPDVAAAQAGPDSTAADSAARRLRAVRVTETRAAAIVGGASAVVVATDRLRASPAPVLDQVLRDTPFLNIRQNSRGEMEISIRGSDARQAAVMLDGVPLTLGWDHRADPSLVPVTGSEELVIVRGLGSLLGGPNALGGTISISQGSSVAAAGTRQVWGGLGVDDNAAFVASAGASSTVSAGSGVLTMRGGFAARDRDGLSLANAVPDATSRDGLRTNSDLREIDAFASLRWNGARGRAVGMTLTGFDAQRGVPPEEHLAVPRLWRYPYSTRALVALSGSLGLFETPFGYGTLDVSAGYNGGRQKIQSYTSRSYTTVEGEELGDERTLTTRALATHSLPRGAKLSAALTLADVSYTETVSPAPAADYRQVLWSGGAEIDMPVGTATTYSFGAVFDRATTPETGGRGPGQSALDDLGWRAGVVRELSNAWRMHASASQRSRFPALRELYSGALDRFRPNPDLRPEKLLGLEGGATFHGAIGAIPIATVQLTAFRHALDDAVVRITLSNPTQLMRVNRDRIESSGAEVLTGFTFGESLRAVTLSADATVQRIRLIDQTTTGPARHAENNPEVRGTVALGAPMPWSARGLANIRYTGTQYCLNAETGGEMTLAAQGTSDIGLERSFTLSRRGPFRALRALLSLDNVSNVAVYDQCGLPQPGRTLRVMLNVR